MVAGDRITTRDPHCKPDLAKLLHLRCTIIQSYFGSLVEGVIPKLNQYRLVAGFSFFQDHCEAATTKTEALLDLACNRNLGAVSGHAEALAINPHASSSVINLKNTIAQGAEGV